MADFNGTILTNAGRDILTKALAGAKLTFSRIGIGDGVWDDGANPEQMVALKDEKKSLPIQELSVVGDGTTRLRFVLTNSGLTEGFFFREIGIFALDPDTQEEKLYAVAYAENPDFIPSDGVTKVENVVDIYTVVSTAQSVTAVISDTVVLATKEDIEQHNSDPDAHPSLLQAVSNSAKADLSNITGLGNLLNLDGSGSGLDADKLDGFDTSQTPGANKIPVADGNGSVKDWITDSEILDKLKNVDGANSGLDADLVRGLPADFSAAIATSGFTKLPNGLIIQWGTYYNSSDGTYTVPLPITFPNEVLMVLGYSADALASTEDSYSGSAGKDTLSTIKITVDYHHPTAWLAIGY